ncbi:hypothetical protein HD554DRAFT_2097816 [Boletus coccyginus]|nr:hypothetical protein HD554DRAFT_2105238 [Boletus coccyginus]KAI9568755.1 hypothetical protein HD554DRAFT_2097816 [Boletus coccyginus]
MTSSATQTMVRPDVEYIGDDHAFLQPLLVTISFSGPLPRHLIRRQIEPVKITVSLSEEYNQFTAPVLRANAWSSYQSEHSEYMTPHPNTVQFSSSDDIGMETCPQDFTIPFLPLPAAFDYTDTRQWASLSKEIEDWLVANIESSALSGWSWGRDAFWMAFVGAHPVFPSGRWALWDPNIPMEGTFIQEWLVGGEPDSELPDSELPDSDDASDAGNDLTLSDCSVTLSYVWDSFSKHASLFYPFPLIKASV